ncbi:MAG: YeeE/YedE thiosulfate transporter family protein, partial [Pseudomonadota bacterium]
MPASAALAPAAARPVQPIPLALAALALAGVAALAHGQGGARLALAALIGGGAGVGLYHASFGFTSAWRRIVRERRGAGLRAQMLLIFLACCLSFPLMGGWLEAAGGRMSGWVLPMGVASAVGAFLFGIGMQLGGGCASGTLFTVGGGSTRMV